MAQIKSYLAEISANSRISKPFLINSVKEFLQSYVLNFLYGNPKYNQLLFTGGTCLRYCFDLPRLSEDLDFDAVEMPDKKALAEELLALFHSNLVFPNAEAKIKGQYEKIYLKFDIARELGLVEGAESNKIFLKLEINKEAVGIYTKEVSLINKNNLSFLVSRYSLPDLMSGKLGAIFTRSYFKGKENEIDFKGRDYFDLIWYMSRGVMFNLDRFNKMLELAEYGRIFVSRAEVIKEIGNKVETLNIKHLEADLRPFIADQNYLDSWLGGFKQILGSLAGKY